MKTIVNLLMISVIIGILLIETSCRHGECNSTANKIVHDSINKNIPKDTYEELIELQIIMGKQTPFHPKSLGYPVDAKDLGFPTF